MTCLSFLKPLFSVFRFRYLGWRAFPLAALVIRRLSVVAVGRGRTRAIECNQAHFFIVNSYRCAISE